MIISKKSWHYRLQQYVLGTVPKYNGLCPYFWMTLACLLFFTPVLLKKEVYDTVKNWINSVAEAAHRRYLLGMSEEELYQYYSRVSNSKFYDDMDLLMKEGKFDMEYVNKLLQDFYQRRKKEIQASARAEARFLEIVEKTSNVIKKIGKVLGYVFIGALILIAIGLVITLFYEIHTKGQWKTFFIIIGVIAAVIITFGIIFVVHDEIKYSEGYRSSKRKLFKLLKSPFVFLYGKTKAALDFIFENYCPRIEIQD